MLIEVSDQFIKNNHLEKLNLKFEFAIYLYEKDILTLEQASNLAGSDYLSFQKELGYRNIEIHYDAEELERDLRTLASLK